MAVVITLQGFGNYLLFSAVFEMVFNLRRGTSFRFLTRLSRDALKSMLKSDYVSCHHCIYLNNTDCFNSDPCSSFKPFLGESSSRQRNHRP